MNAFLYGRLPAELGSHLGVRIQPVALGQTTSGLPRPSLSAVPRKPLRLERKREPADVLLRLGPAGGSAGIQPAAPDRPSHNPACGMTEVRCRND